MLQENLKKLLPHVIAVVIFIVLSSIYFYPQLEGLQLRQGDTEKSIGMSKEISDFRAKYGTEPLWTNSTFCGMPAYQISTKDANYVVPVENALILHPFSRPIGYILLAMIAFYILLLCFELDPWLSTIGAIAFGFSSIFVLYLSGGHNSKVHAIALLPALIGSLILAYRKDYKIGAILLSFFLCLEVAANHLQMTYYSLFLVAAIVVVEMIIHFKNKLYLRFVKVSAVLVVAGILGVLPSISNLYTTYEYGKYSTRGKSELTITPPSAATQGKSTTQDALDPNYITEYNIGTGESWSVAIPNVKGGEATYIGNKKEVIEAVDPQFQEFVAQQNSYWGEQSYSGGAFYFGATIFLLFVLGLVFIKDKIKWAFLAASVIGVVASWKYGSLIQFFIDYVPLFNKFRDTKMALIIVQISFPVVALLFIKEIFTNLINKKKLLYTLLAVNGLFLLFYIIPTVFFDFFSRPEADSITKQTPAISALEDARIMIFKKDVLRSLVFMLIVSGLVYTFVIGKLKKNILLISLGFIVLLDLWLVDKRYLNNEEVGNGYKNWVRTQQYNNPYRASKADIYILNHEISADSVLRDKIGAAVNDALANVKASETDIQRERLTFRELGFATDYRVLTLDNPFSNAEVSYFHKSLGGYHGAKLKEYQELLDFYVNNEYATIRRAFGDSTFSYKKLDELYRTKIPLLNMLNAKYIIAGPDNPAFYNPYTLGNCWFVRDIKQVENADEEMLSLGKVDLSKTAVVKKKFSNELQQVQFDSSASIKLKSCLPNHMVYNSKSNTQQIAVFSEIYYPKGWNAYIDGKKTSYFSTNYLLRAMRVPAGEHTIEFKFEPQSYYIGEKISIASSILLIVLLIGTLGFEVYRKLKT